MANIRVDLNSSVVNGQPVTFRSPAVCSTVDGLIVYYPQNGEAASKTFQFADAHGNNVGGKDLFAENVIVKVLLDTELNRAYVQNADTNAYLERRFDDKSDKDHKHNASEIVGACLFGYVEYVGTGTYGEDNPTVISFDFAPKMILTWRPTQLNNPSVIDMQALTTSYTNFGGNIDLYLKKSSDGKTLYMYCDDDGSVLIGSYQYNTTGTTYRWYVFG